MFFLLSFTFPTTVSELLLGLFQNHFDFFQVLKAQTALKSQNMGMGERPQNHHAATGNNNSQG